MFYQLIKYFKQRHRISLVGVLCLIVVYVSAQSVLQADLSYATSQIPQTPQKPAQQQPQTKKKQGNLIEIRSATISKRLGFEPQVLTDTVVFFHDGAFLFCDSAYYDEKLNTFEAFSNVRMEQGDTLFLYGNYMHYDGNTKVVIVRENVSLEDIPQGATLFTDSLNYDRINNIGYYFDGGMLVDSLNELTSFWGQYQPDLHKALFVDSVILKNPQFTLYSDSLLYDTNTRIANIVSPTRIESDSGTILTSKGWYDTQTDQSLLLDQSTIINKAGDQTLRGDSIYYHRADGYGEIFGNMFLQDTTKKVILRGHYGRYNERTSYAMATDSAFCIEYSQGDSLYLHADTLEMVTIIDSLKIDTVLPIEKAIATPAEIAKEVADSTQTLAAELPLELPADTSRVLPLTKIEPIQPKDITIPPVAETDSIKSGDVKIDSIKPAVAKKKTEPEKHQQIKAYHGVRFYRSDMQGVCDSLQFNSRDSVLYMYKDPILWNETNQISGDTIVVFMNDSTIDYVHVRRYSFSIEEKDSLHYNQLKGRSMKAFFEDKKVKRILVEGNAESIFYPEEKGGGMIGLNWLESSYLEILMKDGQLERLKTWPKSTGKMTPLEMINSDQRKLKDFYWYDYLRPVDKDDIFRKTTRKATDMRPKRSAIFDREE